MLRWDAWTDLRSGVKSRGDAKSERGQWETRADHHIEWLR